MLRSDFILVFLVLLASVPAQEPSRSSRPNVLWLVVEDMSPWIPCYGDHTVPTPNLDRLARQSVRYAHAFATSPVCAPARSSLITGMYATRIGTMQMRTGNPSRASLARDPDAYAEIPNYEGVPPAFVRCFPEVLRAHGYYCTNNSKTDYQFKAPATVWDASGGKAHWRKRADGQPFFAVFNHGGTHESQAFPKSRLAPAVVRPEEVPVPPIYPDTPAVRDALARTYNNIARMDAWVGERLAELDEAGLTDSTVVFFYSDHGVGLPRGKRSPYDLGTRVPLLVRMPDGEGAGRVEDRVVQFVDFGPTVLSLAGVEPDRRLDGIPFLGEHRRPGAGLAFAHADRFDAVYDRARSVSDGRFRYVRNYVREMPHLIDNAYRDNLPMMADLRALADAADGEHFSRWQVASTSRPGEELYDALADPWETVNRVHDPELAAVRDRLRVALDDWIESTGDLGLVLPEKRMVRERLWGGDEKPTTAAPVAEARDGQIVVTCATEGASIGYRTGGKGPWTVYTGPFAAPEGAEVELVAHRIGYGPARGVASGLR